MTTIITPAPAYQRPSGMMYLSAIQENLVDGVNTLVELDTIVTGFTDGIEDTTNHKITPGYAGFYIVLGMVTFANVVAAKNYRAGIGISGSAYPCFNSGWTGGGVYLGVPVLALVKLTATDYVSLYARSDSGDDTVDIYGAESRTFLSVQRVR